MTPFYTSNRRLTAFRLLTATLAFCILLLPIRAEWMYHRHFGHLASYGLTTDLIRIKEEVGIPGVRTVSCLAVSNFTLFPLRFETAQLPGGILGSGPLSRYRIEKWNENTRTWVTLFDSATNNDPSLLHPDSTVTIWPGQSFYPVGCLALAGFQGVHKGDLIRIAALTSFELPKRTIERVFYSPAIHIDEERLTL